MAHDITLTDALRDTYNRLFEQAAIRPAFAGAVNTLTDRLLQGDHWTRYTAVGARTGVPAQVVGILHAMETGLRFTRHLHNGDPLTARTVHVPAGRPATGQPPFLWEDSAEDALRLHALDRWHDWSLPGIAYTLEGYNGWGYRRYHPDVPSPYLWSGTTVYTSGKYVADGHFDATTVSKQCGGMAILQALAKRGHAQLEASSGANHNNRPVQTDAVSPARPVWNGGLLRKGATGPAVRRLQQRLLECGFAQVGRVDGVFGAHTALAVRAFQAMARNAAGAPLARDGLVGRQTWQALFAEKDALREGGTPPAAKGHSSLETP